MESFFPPFISKNKPHEIEEEENTFLTLNHTNIALNSYSTLTNDHIDLIETLPGEYDMLQLSEIIKEKIINNTTLVPSFKKRIEQLKWIQDNTQDVIEREEAKTKIFEIEREIGKLSNNKQLLEYNKLTTSLLSEYDKILNTQIKTDFLNENSMCNLYIKHRRLQLQYEFLQIVSKFVKITPFKNLKKIKNNIICKDCNSTSFEIDIDDMMICKKCGVCTQTYEDEPTFKDKERLNMSKRFRYTRDRHFKEAMIKYQGKQNTTIPQELYDHIDEFMKQNPNITKKNLTHSHIILVMNMYAISRYDDVWLIHSTVTNIPAPDISHLEEKLFTDYEYQNRVVGHIKIKDDSKNSLNVFYQLCRLLQKNGYACKLQDFYCIKTDDTKEKHDEVWIKRCKKLGWDYPILD